MSDKKSTILIVDDTETNIDILLDLLSEYDVAVATDGESALEIASQECIDMILLDIMMPVMDGYEVCRRMKSKNETKDIPIIFITAKADEDSIEKAYDAGGIDYVTKPFKPRELLARVSTHLEFRKLINHLDYMASYDQMTGIYNRRKFFELANEKFSETKKDLYAVMMDIDKFKAINDKYGHDTGDKVIKQVAKIISDSVSEDEIFARIGGEEFALVSDSAENIVEKMENLREAIEKLEVYSNDGDVVRCTISNGISKRSEEYNSIDELLKEADKALYEAKGSGRNKVIFR